MAQHHRDAGAVQLGALARETVNAAWALGMPLIVLGGIYSGLFSATEAGGIACVYAIVVATAVYREVGFRDFVQLSRRAAYITSQIMIIVASAGVFSWLLTTSGVGPSITAFFALLDWPPWMLLLIINILLLIVGCFIDTASAILLLTPILVPIVRAAGIDLDPFRHRHDGQSEHRLLHAAVRHQHLRGAGGVQAAGVGDLCRRRSFHRGERDRARADHLRTGASLFLTKLHD